jgi:hypothetical protein
VFSSVDEILPSLLCNQLNRHHRRRPIRRRSDSPYATTTPSSVERLIKVDAPPPPPSSLLSSSSPSSSSSDAAHVSSTASLQLHKSPSVPWQLTLSASSSSSNSAFGAAASRTPGRRQFSSAQTEGDATRDIMSNKFAHRNSSPSPAAAGKPATPHALAPHSTHRYGHTPARAHAGKAALAAAAAAAASAGSGAGAGAGSSAEGATAGGLSSSASAAALLVARNTLLDDDADGSAPFRPSIRVLPSPQQQQHASSRHETFRPVGGSRAMFVVHGTAPVSDAAAGAQTPTNHGNGSLLSPANAAHAASTVSIIGISHPAAETSEPDFRPALRSVPGHHLAFETQACGSEMRPFASTTSICHSFLPF